MKSSHIVKQAYRIDKDMRSKLLGQKPLIIWLTGLSGSGKSTLADRLEQELAARSVHTYLLDGDNVRHGLNSDIDFSAAGRTENIRRIGEVSKLFVDAGLVVITAFISPFRADRDKVRSLVAPGEFIEVHVDCPIEICEQRDVKGLYAKARMGLIPEFTGISSPFEVPSQAELTLQTGDQDLETCLNILLDFTLNRIKPSEG